MYRCPLYNSKNGRRPLSHECHRCHYIGDINDFEPPCQMGVCE